MAMVLQGTQQTTKTEQSRVSKTCYTKSKSVSKACYYTNQEVSGDLFVSSCRTCLTVTLNPIWYANIVEELFNWHRTLMRIISLIQCNLKLADYLFVCMVDRYTASPHMFYKLDTPPAYIRFAN